MSQDKAPKRLITIIVPCFNEEAGLEGLVESLKKGLSGNEIAERYRFELLLVNDGSRDGTAEVMKRLRGENDWIHILNLSRNFGKENALLAGMDYAKGDAVVIMDADLQHPVEAIPGMIELWEAGYDDVYGVTSKRPRESWLRRFLSLSYYKILQRASRLDTLPRGEDFRLLDRNCLDAVRNMREVKRNNKALIAWVGFKKGKVEFQKADGVRKSRFNLFSLFNLAVDGIVSFTTAPLRFATVMGVLVSLVSFLYMIFVLVRTLIYGDPVRGFPTLMVVILFLGGCQLLALGIIGEYIGKIFQETKGRRPYIAEEYDGEKINQSKDETGGKK